MACPWLRLEGSCAGRLKLYRTLRPVPPLTANPLCAERRTCSARRLDICSELPLLQHELSSRRQCCLCIRLEHLQVCSRTLYTLCTPSAHSASTDPPHRRLPLAGMRSPPSPPFAPSQLKRYNKRSLDHNKHAVAAESLLLLKSASAHSPTAIDPVHTKPSDLSQVRLRRTVPLQLPSAPLHLLLPHRCTLFVAAHLRARPPPRRPAGARTLARPARRPWTVAASRRGGSATSLPVVTSRGSAAGQVTV